MYVLEVLEDHYIHVCPLQRKLFLIEHGAISMCYPVQLARNGLGELSGSEKTPRGWHKIYQMIGAGLPMDTYYKSRVPQGVTNDLNDMDLTKDWIVGRILWLEGCEVGKNLNGAVDTRARYIYIHGVPEAIFLKGLGSKGCINMLPHDVDNLFNHVMQNLRIFIDNDKGSS